MKIKKRKAAERNLLTVREQVPQDDWSLEQLTAIIQTVGVFRAKAAWLIGKAVNLAERHFDSAKSWEQWQTERAEAIGKSYQTIRRYAQMAERLTFAEADGLTVQEAYDNADIPTNSAKGRKSKRAKRRGNAPTLELPEDHPKDEATATTPLNDVDAQQSLLRLAKRVGGLPKLKALLEILLEQSEGCAA